MEKGIQASLMVSAVLGLSLVYVGYQVSALETQVDQLEWRIITAGVTIDDGTDNIRIENVRLTRGASALEALERVAVIETRYYAGLGAYIVSVNGTSENHEEGKYWMWYIWDDNKMSWELATVGAESYELKDGDNIKFSYETASW